MKKKQTSSCPTCGGTMIIKKGSVTFPIDKKGVTVRNLTYEECLTCQEKVFDYQAHVQIEKVIYRGKKSSAA